MYDHAFTARDCSDNVPDLRRDLVGYHAHSAASAVSTGSQGRDCDHLFNMADLFIASVCRRAAYTRTYPLDTAAPPMQRQRDVRSGDSPLCEFYSGIGT